MFSGVNTSLTTTTWAGECMLEPTSDRSGAAVPSRLPRGGRRGDRAAPPRDGLGMAFLKLLLDEMYPPALAEALRSVASRPARSPMWAWPAGRGPTFWQPPRRTATSCSPRTSRTSLASRLITRPPAGTTRGCSLPSRRGSHAVGPASAPSSRRSEPWSPTVVSEALQDRLLYLEEPPGSGP